MDEKIKKFLSIEDSYYEASAAYGEDWGWGKGSGGDSFLINGYDAEYGKGPGCGEGSYDIFHRHYDGEGDGGGYASGKGREFGDGSSCGLYCGSGYGSYHESSSDHGNCYNINKINGHKVYVVDGIPTLINKVHGNMAKGYILLDNLFLTPCYIVRNEKFFAHGKTVREATESLYEKIFAQKSEKKRIDAFVEEFATLDTIVSVKELYHWHNKLTGSCKLGREKFAKDHYLDIEHDKMTVSEFIELTKESFGGKTIKKLAERYK